VSIDSAVLCDAKPWKAFASRQGGGIDSERYRHAIDAVLIHVYEVFFFLSFRCDAGLAGATPPN